MNLKVIILAAAILLGGALTACGKSGGGNNQQTASPYAGGCVYDSAGNCIAGMGQPGYVGNGQWGGTLTIQNIAGWQQFAYQNGLCMGQDCAYISNYINLQISLNNPNGCLPGGGNFVIRSYRQGWGGPTLSQRAEAHMNTSNNGFFLSYMGRNPYGVYGGGYGGGFGAGYYGQPQTTTTTNGTLQINAQFTDAIRRTLNVQLIYAGQQIAAGQISGASQYYPGAVSTVGMCQGGGLGGGWGGGGLGGGWGGGYTWPSTGGGYYYPYQQRM